MKNFIALNGQSIWDICLNTYSSLDFIIKIIMDNDFGSVDVIPMSGEIFEYDDTLIKNQSLTSKTIYSTSQKSNGSVFSTIIGGTNDDDGGGGTTHGGDMQKYQQTGQEQYTSGVDGQTIISLPGLIGYDIIQVEKEIKPLKYIQYGWNKSSGTLSLLGGTALDFGETLFILWSKIIIV